MALANIEAIVSPSSCAPTRSRDVALANIEALASGEGGIGISSLCAYQRDFWCIYPAVVGEDGTVLDEATRVQGVITTDAGDGAYTVGG